MALRTSRSSWSIGHRWIGLATALCVTLGFSTSRAYASPDPDQARMQAVKIGSYGVACKLTAWNDGRLGPTNYRAADVQKLGVPKLTPAQLTALREASTLMHGLQEIWFAFVKDDDGKSIFIVFSIPFEDATRTPNPYDRDEIPCTGNPVGYGILNLPAGHFYQSGEWGKITQCCGEAPRR